MVGDAAWEKIAPLLPGKASDPGRRPKTIGCFLGGAVACADGRALARSAE